MAIGMAAASCRDVLPCGHVHGRLLRIVCSKETLLSFVGALAYVCALGGSLAAQNAPFASTRIGPDAVFAPGMESMRSARELCKAAGGAQLVDCFAAEMQKAGAPAAAVAFSRKLDRPGYLRDFRFVGPVDIAYAVLPYRANENQACFLVNGSPALIDVDDQALLARGSLTQDATYASIVHAFPQVTLSPGARDGTRYPDVENNADGGARVVVAYRLRNQCHACATLGTAWFAFNFDPQGEFLGTTLAGVTKASNAGAALVGTDPARTIVAAVGEEFRIVLSSNITTGYSWAHLPPPGTNKARLVGARYHAPETKLPGAAGTESWTFGALGEGETEIAFGYRRPWEKNVAPIAIRKFAVVIRP